MQHLRGGVSDRIDLIVLDNGCTKLTVVPTRGMGIWKGSCAGIPLEWQSPVERPVHPTFVDQSRRGGIGWLDGFNELIVRCGLGWHGAPGTDSATDQFLPLHGRIANLPAHRVTLEVSPDGQITLTGEVDEASLFGGRLRLTSRLITHIGSNSFEIHDTVSNLGGSPAEVEMLYHCNFGPPFLEEGSEFLIPAAEVAPRDSRAAEGISDWNQLSGPEAGYAEQVYFVRPLADANEQASAVLKNAASDKAVGLRFDLNTLPWFVLWKNTQAKEDGYCVGLEPAGSFPNLRSFEREHGRVRTLDAGSCVDYRFDFTIADNAQSVNDLVAGLEAKTSSETVVHAQPRSDWSA